MIEFLLMALSVALFLLAAAALMITLSGLSVVVRGITVRWDVVMKEGLSSGDDFTIDGLSYYNAVTVIDDMRDWTGAPLESAVARCTGMYLRPRLGWSYEKLLRTRPF